MPRYDHTFEERMRAKGYGVRCMWQSAGPKNTMVESMECLTVYKPETVPHLFIVQTLAGGGWNVFADIADNNINAVIETAEASIKAPSAPAKLGDRKIALIDRTTGLQHTMTLREFIDDNNDGFDATEALTIIEAIAAGTSHFDAFHMGGDYEVKPL